MCLLLFVAVLQPHVGFTSPYWCQIKINMWFARSIEWLLLALILMEWKIKALLYFRLTICNCVP